VRGGNVSNGTAAAAATAAVDTDADAGSCMAHIATDRRGRPLITCVVRCGASACREGMCLKQQRTCSCSS